MNTGLSDETVEKALDHLRFKAQDAAKAKANRVYMEEYRKTIKATLMKDHIDLPVSAQEREAYAHPDYKAHLEALKIAVEQDELHRWKMIAAQAVIDAWRTYQANRRGEQKIG